MDPTKELLVRYLNSNRDAVRFKLAGVSERELRMPMTPTGTNMLGIVKHLASVEAGYFGECFGTPCPEPMAWYDSDEPNADMYASADESPEYILGVYDRIIEFSNAQIDALALDDVATVPWWGPAETTLQHLLVHMIAETARHAGHLDIVRESIDGSAGHREGISNLPDVDAAWWNSYVTRLRDIADAAPGRARDSGAAS